MRNHAKVFFDAVEEGETVRVYRNGRPVADIVPIKAAMPAWKKPPEVRLSLGNLSLGDEVLADRDEETMRIFFDTSALTKRYVEEEGSEQVRALCIEADTLGVSVLLVPELISTLCSAGARGPAFL